MKTLLVFLLVLLLVAAAIALDAHRLDAASWFSAIVVAGLFALAHRDSAPRGRPSGVVRRSGARAAPSAVWTDRNVCVLCDASAS